MHQVVEPSTIDRRYTRLHRVAAPAVVARNGIAGVQSAISRAGAATIVHEEPFKRILPAATVIPHGIEDVTPMARDAARRQLALDDRFVVLCFGFLAPYKGIELVLDAAGKMRADIQVVIAGGEHPRMADGNSFGAELRERYGDVARFTGWVPDGDVSAWFSAADLCVFPYPKPFASSGVLALALAHGAPVLLSPALARCAGAPSVLTSPMAAGPLARRIEAAGRRSRCARRARRVERRARRRPALAVGLRAARPSVRGGARWRPSRSSARSGRVIRATKRSARRSARRSPSTT